MRNIEAKSTDGVSEAGQQITRNCARRISEFMDLRRSFSIPSCASRDFTESFPLHLKDFVLFFFSDLFGHLAFDPRL